MPVDPYTVPDGVQLDSGDVRDALDRKFISTKTYQANGATNHVYRDHVRGLKLFVVESGTSKRLVEVVGDTLLWLTVRETAARVAFDQLANQRDGETVEHVDAMPELIAA